MDFHSNGPDKIVSVQDPSVKVEYVVVDLVARAVAGPREQVV